MLDVSIIGGRHNGLVCANYLAMAGTLAAVTISYLPYCFFNLINPVMALLFACLNVKILRVKGVVLSLIPIRIQKLKARRPIKARESMNSGRNLRVHI